MSVARDVQSVQTWLDENLGRLLAERGVVGASAAVLVNGEVAEAAAGLASLSTKVEATTDTVFQIGSVTKLWTSALVMQLVDDGLLDIDVPIQTYLPEFAIADAQTSKTITTRQILCHVAGFEGDIFTDTGRGDDAIEKYVASIHHIPQLFEPGEVFSYNNTGFVVLGRLIEVLREKPFDAVLLERLAQPLGLTSVSPSPYEAIIHRVAVGHIGGEDGTVSAPEWALAHSNAPAGSMLAMTARDLIGFLRMHVDGGKASDGTVILKPETVAEMQRKQVELPSLALMGGFWGLGWEMEEHDGKPIIGHDGGTIGQYAFLRWAPEEGVAVALLTNGGDDFLGLYRDVVGGLLEEVAGVVLPGNKVPPAEPIEYDPTPYLGHYSDTIYDITVSQAEDGTVWLDRVPKDVIAEIGEKPIRLQLVKYEGDSLIALDTMYGIHPVYAFIGRNDGGLAKYVHYGRVVSRSQE